MSTCDGICNKIESPTSADDLSLYATAKPMYSSIQAKEEAYMLRQVAFLDECMPKKEACVFRLTTNKGLIWKRLFIAVREIVSTARLVINDQTIELVNQQDPESRIVVQFSLHRKQLEQSGTYFLNRKSLFIPLDVDALTYALHNVEANHVMGLCVTINSARADCRTLDLYVTEPKENAGYYVERIQFLNKEYKKFGEAVFKMGAISSQIDLETHQFKRLLSTAQRRHQVTEMTLEFGPKFTSFKPQIHTTFASSMELRVPSSLYIHRMDVDDDIQVHEDMIVVTGCFSIKKFLRVTKAAKLSETIQFVYSPGFPLGLEYVVDAWGTLLFKVYEEYPDEDKKDTIMDCPPYTSVCDTQKKRALESTESSQFKKKQKKPKKKLHWSQQDVLTAESERQQEILENMSGTNTPTVPGYFLCRPSGMDHVDPPTPNQDVHGYTQSDYDQMDTDHKQFHEFRDGMLKLCK